MPKMLKNFNENNKKIIRDMTSRSQNKNIPKKTKNQQKNSNPKEG